MLRLISVCSLEMNNRMSEFHLTKLILEEDEHFHGMENEIRSNERRTTPTDGSMSFVFIAFSSTCSRKTLDQSTNRCVMIFRWGKNLRSAVDSSFHFQRSTGEREVEGEGNSLGEDDPQTIE